MSEELSQEIIDSYEVVIGLEVHAQLLTHSKAFCGDPTTYGAAPNTQVSVLSLGHPGTLPKLNTSVVDFAIKLGLALDCEITEVNRFARKNYFYPDLPKGYQISQFNTPICTGGKVVVDLDGKEKEIALTRIHMEEDAGKSIHDTDPFHTLVDLNRAGVPLLEIVTEPDLRSSDEAYAYLNEVRRLLRYLEICDGNMEEGSMRCDANVSVRKYGDPYGEKVEVKNMNSMRNVKRALDYEVIRQIKAIESGEKIHQETRTFDAVNGRTLGMRSKEFAHDYRYFPEPDLPPVIVTAKHIEKVRATMPPLPRALKKHYVEELELSEYDAGVLTEEKGVALYFEEVIKHTENFKGAANWVMGPVKSWLNERTENIENFPITADSLAGIIALVDSGEISNSVARKDLFEALLDQPEKTPNELAAELNLTQQSDEGVLEDFIKKALSMYPDKVEEYKNGKKGLIGLFMGEVMKMSKGKADPRRTNQLLTQMLNQE